MGRETVYGLLPPNTKLRDLRLELPDHPGASQISVRNGLNNTQSHNIEISRDLIISPLTE